MKVSSVSETRYGSMMKIFDLRQIIDTPDLQSVYYAPVTIIVLVY